MTHHGVMIRDGKIASVVKGRAPDLPTEGDNLPECRPKRRMDFLRGKDGKLLRDERGWPKEGMVDCEPDFLRFVRLPDWWDFGDDAFFNLVDEHGSEADLLALVEEKDAERRAPEEAAVLVSGLWETLKAKGIVSDDDLPEQARAVLERRRAVGKKGAKKK